MRKVRAAYEFRSRCLYEVLDRGATSEMTRNPENGVSPERHLIRELRGTSKSFVRRLAAGSLEVRYPPVRDHQAVVALTAWLVAVDTFIAASRAALKAIPPGEVHTIVGQLGGFTRRAANLVRQKVG